MIISHQHKFVFIAVPKTATHAIRFALRSKLASSDWEQVELFHHSRIPFDSFKHVKHGHQTAREANETISAKKWDSYLKFAFVRNPYDRFISAALFKHKKRNDFSHHHTTAKLKLLVNSFAHKCDLIYRPQSHFVCNEKGESMLDIVAPYEDLQKSFNQICRKIGVEPLQLEIRNRNHHATYTSYYDDELKEMVYDFYKEDFVNYNYQK
ncbi:MAG: sulfotransferase family 2 domain-containing protein [Vicingaceae bacterium]